MMETLDERNVGRSMEVSVGNGVKVTVALTSPISWHGSCMCLEKLQLYLKMKMIWLVAVMKKVVFV